MTSVYFLVKSIFKISSNKEVCVMWVTLMSVTFNRHSFCIPKSSSFETSCLILSGATVNKLFASQYHPNMHIFL